MGFGPAIVPATEPCALGLDQSVGEEGDGPVTASLAGRQPGDGDGQDGGLFMAQTLGGARLGHGAVEMLPQAARLGGALTAARFDVASVRREGARAGGSWARRNHWAARWWSART